MDAMMNVARTATRTAVGARRTARRLARLLLVGLASFSVPAAGAAQGTVIQALSGPSAQQGTPSALAPDAPASCMCTTRPVDPPWVPPVTPPGVPEVPVGPQPPGSPESPGGSPTRRGWAAVGAAGLALVAGVPLGSALQPAMPFRPVVAEIAEQPVIVASAPAAVPLPVEAAGVLAPNTASHLPLLLAIGIAAIAAGIALLRDRKRRRRRRRVVVS